MQLICMQIDKLSIILIKNMLKGLKKTTHIYNVYHVHANNLK